MNLETLYMKTIINELDLIKQTLLLFIETSRKKDLLSFPTRLIERYLILLIPKDTINLI